jgi:hypothetical protein
VSSVAPFVLFVSFVVIGVHWPSPSATMAHQAFIQTADERIEAETASLEFTEDTE